MPIIGRSGVVTGDTIPLRSLVVDDTGCLRDTDALPSVYIYDANVDTTLIQEEIDAATYASAIAGPLVPTLISTGFYELSYTVPSAGVEGTWHDVWVGAIDTVPFSEILSFEVAAGGDFESQSLGYNQVILIDLDASIGDVTATKTLTQDITLMFTTRYRPYYSSVELVRMEGGPQLDYIPDDTLAMMIHWSSLEVDCISPPKRCGKKYNYARTKFIQFDAALRALLLPGGGASSPLSSSASSGAVKTLGELTIEAGGASSSTASTLSGGVDLDTIKYFRDWRDEWWRVVNAGGCIVPGEGLGASMAIRGLHDPNRRFAGRLWEDPGDQHYSHPTTNTKFRRPGAGHHRFGHSPWRNRSGATRSRPQYRRRDDGFH